MQRLSIYSQKSKPMQIDGQIVLVPVLDDLNDEDLVKAIEYYVDSEDYEYLEQLCVEAQIRGINTQQFFNVKKQ